MLRAIMQRCPGRTAFRRGRFGLSGLALLAACATGAPGIPTVAGEAEWRALASARPEPLPGAARVAVGDVELAGEVAWGVAVGLIDGAEAGEIAIAELVSAGLLRRRDVYFVERRRFTLAVAAERRGERRPPGAPAAGVSPSPDYVASAVWLSLMPGRSTAEVRLTDATSGVVAASSRVQLAGEADPVSIGRSIVRALLDALDEVGDRPAWADPLTRGDGTTTGGGVPAAAVASFLRGLTAEERYEWETARRGYQTAAREPSFFEASAALARTARLRLGGTLGES